MVVLHRLCNSSQHRFGQSWSVHKASCPHYMFTDLEAHSHGGSNILWFVFQNKHGAWRSSHNDGYASHKISSEVFSSAPCHQTTLQISFPFWVSVDLHSVRAYAGKPGYYPLETATWISWTVCQAARDGHCTCDSDRWFSLSAGFATLDRLYLYFAVRMKMWNQS